MVEPTNPKCPVCGMYHPKPFCTDTQGLNPDDINVFIGNFKNILVSQMKMKGVANQKKLLQNLTLQLTKYIEEYKE